MTALVVSVFRINKARAAFVNLGQLWRSSIYRLKTKLDLFNAICKSTLLFGSECWTLMKKSPKKLQVFQQRCLRILKVFYPNLVSNVEILKRAEQKDIVSEIMEKRWRWVVHIQRKDEGHLTKEAFMWEPAGKRKRGRPRLTWKRMMEDDAKRVQEPARASRRLKLLASSICGRVSRPVTSRLSK
jgi:hypothetical protein